MIYATPDDVELGFRELSADEKKTAENLLEEAAMLIDAINRNATADAKRVVSCRVVRRAIGSTDAGMPVGATQGSMSALGYQQSWGMGNSGAGYGEIYIGRTERTMLGVTGGEIGATNPYGGGRNDKGHRCCDLR